MPPRRGRKAKAPAPTVPEDQPAEEQVSTAQDPTPPTVEDGITLEQLTTETGHQPEPEPPADSARTPTPSSEAGQESLAVEPEPGPSSPPAPKMSMDDRQAKMEELRQRMRSSMQANRKDLVDEHSKQKTTVRELARLEKQRKLADTLRQKADAEELGEDLERKKNWEYTIEENDDWEKRQARKQRRSNFEFNDFEDAARRRYKKDLDLLKPDLDAYSKQKEATQGSSSSALTASEDLYRDANSLIYADNKPTDDDIDRVISKLNMDADRRSKFSKKRANDDDGDVTYINERNKIFNKTIARYYDKYTAEIRASFERGTAL